MKIAIIGATGMIGHHTAIAALERGHELVIVHRKSSDLGSIGNLKFSSAIADLNDRKALREAFKGVDAVINCAAYYPTEPLPWRTEVETAVSQTENFYAACSEADLQKIVYLGAAIALPKHPSGQPGTEELIYSDRPPDKTPYVQVKWVMDFMAREKAKSGLPVVIGIPSMCFGEFDYGPSTGRLIVEIAKRSIPGYIRGDRNVIYAGDAGLGLILACEKGKIGERYLFTGVNISMDELVPLIARIADVPAPKKTIPLVAAKLISKFQENRFKLLGGELPRLSSTAIAVMASGQFLNGDKARNELDFSCRLNLNETISRALRWLTQNGYIR
jgi:dihydroflavonol-4-reductase